MRHPNRPDGWAAGLAVVLGVVVGAGGTLVHRWEPGGWPAGIVLALISALVAGICARAAAGRTGPALVGIAALATAFTLAFVRPGDDVLVTAEPIGQVLLAGLPVAAILAAVTPRRWYADEPVPPPHLAHARAAAAPDRSDG